jgi:hypothetical protein
MAPSMVTRILGVPPASSTGDRSSSAHSNLVSSNSGDVVR